MRNMKIYYILLENYINRELININLFMSTNTINFYSIIAGEYNDYIYITTDHARSFIAAIINVSREERTLV